ncbi:MAG: HAD-IB family hydrolase [Deltaproteobacteria bacterium]|nr:HAD-IB family hydrolase [Deltaproteobacteria bacterium]
MKAAIFDLDRTLVPVNTASLFVRWQLERGEARRRDLLKSLFWLGQYTLGVIDAGDIARRAARPLRGKNEAAFRELMRGWVDAQVLPKVTEAAKREIAARRSEGFVCAILTGSTAYSADPLGLALGIEHIIGSELEVRGGSFTGELVDPLCFGHGKVTRAEAWASRHGIDLSQSVFYSDSISDLPMLERVKEPIAVNPDPRLRVLAKWRGWRRLYWT